MKYAFHLSVLAMTAQVATAQAPPGITPSPCGEWGCQASRNAVPSCGDPCIVSAAAVVGCADPTDFECRCSKAAEIQPIAMNCVIEGCNNDIFSALEFAESASSLCGCVSTVGNPPTCAPSTPAPSPTADPSPSADVPSSAEPSATDVPSDAPSSAVPSSGASSAPTSSDSEEPTESAGQSAPTKTKNPPPVVTAGAAALGVGSGLGGALVAGLMALL
ncbi:hypothetical protein QBC34DRAFT_477575 [Podospora aff. communis PSN243]|uniref:CFEM domain-containing protein n=1 Tax=Podospora aff. communis PSN243 TaxID=3040156 RepID=A0AAV9G7V2_9PEZI|nr:hypothetical protein QBC34DRAFT_477575 [Podospora aff. communis PSN243]